MLPALDEDLAGAEGFEPPLAVLETAGLPLNLRPCSDRTAGGSGNSLLDFPVRLVLPALRTELLELETLSCRLLVFHVAVIPVLALIALKCDDLARHSLCS